MSKKKLSVYTFTIDSALYRVYPIDEGILNGFKKGNAYFEESECLGEWVLPFRKFVDQLSDVSFSDPVGIYALKDNPTKFRIIYPSVKEADTIYNINRVSNIVKDVADNTKYGTDCFIDTSTQISGLGDWFQPPVREGDDAMNAIVKTAISLKQVPYNAYTGKLKYYAVGDGDGSEGANVKGNTKKSLLLNTRMSTGKAAYYCKSFDLQLGIIVKDAPDAPNPMFGDGSILVIFPNDEFEIDQSKLIKVSEILDNKDEYFGKQKDEPEKDEDIYD